jgi:hypothetical protein
VEHATFIKDLCIMAKQQKPIQKDEWGIRGVLELWFQEIEVNSITLHIQKKHSARQQRYLKDLQEFFRDLDNIDYIKSKSYQEIGFGI